MLRAEFSGLVSSTASAPAQSPTRYSHDDASTVLLVDDELTAERLGPAFRQHGLSVEQAHSLAEAFAAIEAFAPDYALVNTKLRDGTGLEVIRVLRERRRYARVVAFSGYAGIPQAVRAAKIGATDFLHKPLDPAVVLTVLLGRRAGFLAPDAKVMSGEFARWEYIQNALQICSGNISETARRLGMHRRTLQRTLAKNPPR